MDFQCCIIFFDFQMMKGKGIKELLFTSDGPPHLEKAVQMLPDDGVCVCVCVCGACMHVCACACMCMCLFVCKTSFVCVCNVL